MQGSLLATDVRCHLASRGVRFVRLFVTLVVLSALASLSACGRNYPPPPNLPDPVVNLQVGPGDVLEVVVLGEDKLPKEYEIQPDGSLDFPYITKSIKVAGLEPRAIATAIRDQLVESKFLVAPQVQVKVKAFNSKKIQIIGQIAKPGPLPYQDGMTLVQAISAAGWFTPLADTNHVQLIRIVHGESNKSVNAIISVDAITDNARADVKLQQGDTIKVDQRLFSRRRETIAFHAAPATAAHGRDDADDTLARHGRHRRTAAHARRGAHQP